jgi:cytochrome c-type biogenesis protein CcmH
MKPWCIAVLCIFLASPIFAVEPDEILTDSVLEERARALSKELRCVVCQNQDIDSSNAGVARDLRILVRERLVAGDTDQEVLDFMAARYGDFILFKPPLKPSTYLLWFGPGAVLLFALFIGGRALRRGKNAQKPEALSITDEQDLKTYLATSESRR